MPHYRLQTLRGQGHVCCMYFQMVVCAKSKRASDVCNHMWVTWLRMCMQLLSFTARSSWANDSSKHPNSVIWKCWTLIVVATCPLWLVASFVVSKASIILEAIGDKTIQISNTCFWWKNGYVWLTDYNFRKEKKCVKRLWYALLWNHAPYSVHTIL
jgi:hypothetical protein